MSFRITVSHYCAITVLRKPHFWKFLFSTFPEELWYKIPRFPISIRARAIILHLIIVQLEDAPVPSHGVNMDKKSNLSRLPLFTCDKKDFIEVVWQCHGDRMQLVKALVKVYIRDYSHYNIFRTNLHRRRVFL